MRVASETAQVLVTVKATPQPSAKYGDTVCVAGIRVDQGRAEWIRLYPIPFRWLEGERQFKKYDLIEVDVRRRDQDTRTESFSPTQDSIRIVDHVAGWEARDRILRRVTPTTACELSRAATASHSAPSLGTVRVSGVPKVEFIPHAPWTPDQIRRMQQKMDASSTSLFGPSRIPRLLTAPRLKLRYRFRCLAPGCSGHGARNLDWELTAFQNRHRGSDDDLQRQIQTRFVDQMFRGGRLGSMFMGNFEDARKRGSFSVLGVYYPPESVATSRPLWESDDDELIGAGI